MHIETWIDRESLRTDGGVLVHDQVDFCGGLKRLTIRDLRFLTRNFTLLFQVVHWDWYGLV